MRTLFEPSSLMVGSISSTVIIVAGALTFNFSHRYMGMESVLGAIFIIVGIPKLWCVCFTVLMLPFIMRLVWQIIITIASLMGAASYGHYVSQQAWAASENEGIRIFIILAVAIIVNSAIALGVNWED